MLPERPPATKIDANLAYRRQATKEQRAVQKTFLNSDENLVFLGFEGLESCRSGG
jgi:hypothetical protein